VRKSQQILVQFVALGLTEEQRRWTEELEGELNRMWVSAQDIVSLENKLRIYVRRFVAVRLEIDAMVDDQIQILALAALVAPREEAERKTGYVIRTLVLLVPIFVISVIGVGMFLSRTVTKPVNVLMRGTEAISRGNLNYRVGDLSQDDEFGQLANRFNHMLSELNSTTVSKELLERSEANLEATVDQLRQQIVARERTEQDRMRLQRTLRRSEVFATMGSLVAGVAHEVRNPLFAISATLDAFEARFANRSEYKRHVDALRAEVKRLHTLMQALLEYGRPEQLELAPDSPEVAVQEALHFCQPLAERSSVRIWYSRREKSTLIRMNRRHLVHVFQNLLENAIQLSGPGGSVIIEAGEVSHNGSPWISYTIKDSGPGFSVEDLPRVFEPFFTRRAGGTGLGMSIAQRIVEGHEGTICVGNRAEGGAVIVVRFPLVRDDTCRSN
jgi:signal transduction histidine kinase